MREKSAITFSASNIHLKKQQQNKPLSKDILFDQFCLINPERYNRTVKSVKSAGLKHRVFQRVVQIAVNEKKNNEISTFTVIFSLA